jgi:SAM-dependent methyltransferase
VRPEKAGRRRWALADPKDIVERGYDRIGAEYERWSEGATDHAREHYARVLLDGLPEGAAVLDLGSGSGELLTRRLAERFRVTGVELSSRMAELARRNVPDATFVRGDMAAVEFAPGSFDGVCAFYSLIHLPPEELPALLRRAADWLKLGGLFVASMGTGADPGSVEDDWVAGVPMYFVGAIVTHLRVRDYSIGPASAFLLLAVAALVLGLAS